MRIVSVVILFLSMMAYVAAQLTAAGKAFSATFTIEYFSGIVIGASIIIFYTVLGGFRAVAWTDLLQGLLMALSLIVVPAIAVVHIGGFGRLIDGLSQYPDYLSILKKGGMFAALGSVLGLLGIGLGYPGQPHVLARFMAASNDAVIKRGKYIAITWGFLVYTGAILMGLAGKVMVEGVTDQEHVFPVMSSMLLPPVMGGIVLAAVMAAIMSTADSQLLVASSALIRDVYEKIFERRIDQRRVVLLSRSIVFTLGILSVIIAMTEVRIIFWFVLFAWSGLGAGFGPLVILLIRGYRFKPHQAMIGMLLGFLITILWKGGVFNWIFGVALSENLYELIPAFASSFIYLLIAGKRSADPLK